MTGSNRTWCGRSDWSRHSVIRSPEVIIIFLPLSLISHPSLSLSLSRLFSKLPARSSCSSCFFAKAPQMDVLHYQNLISAPVAVSPLPHLSLSPSVCFISIRGGRTARRLNRVRRGAATAWLMNCAALRRSGLAAGTRRVSLRPYAVLREKPSVLKCIKSIFK